MPNISSTILEIYSNLCECLSLLAGIKLTDFNNWKPILKRLIIIIWPYFAGSQEKAASSFEVAQYGLVTTPACKPAARAIRIPSSING